MTAEQLTTCLTMLVLEQSYLRTRLMTPKAGDPMLRRSLYEAANIMLCRVQRPFALQQWGQRIAESKGNKRARIAVARKLAVLLHSLWVNETEFRWA